MEKPVTFKSRKKHRLFGILHVPERGTGINSTVGVNLLNPGIKYRVAPNRLNVKIARKLCEKGYYVLRFDPAGIGDSEGELSQGVLMPDIWEKIQTGLFVPDTVAANNFFIQECDIKKLVLIGNCGGAITALLAAEKDSRISALCLIDVPVNLRTTKLSFADKVVKGGDHAEWLFSEYVKRVLLPKSWYRFFTLRTDYRALWKTVKMKVPEFGKVKRRFLEDRSDENDLIEQEGLNPLFFRAFEKTSANNLRMLFILAGNDPGTEIFHHYFEGLYLKMHRGRSQALKNVEIFKVDGANHVYTLSKWQEALIRRIYAWTDSLERP